MHCYGGVHLADGHSVTFWSEGDAPYRRGPPGTLELAQQARAAHLGENENWFEIERLGHFLICSRRAPCETVP